MKTPEQIFEEADAKGWRRLLVVTALPLEMRAVRAHAKELGHAVARDGTFLELGHFSSQDTDWLVVFAETGAGILEAQNVTQNAFLSFGPFELSIFVGVAGGRKTETVIGTVVSSSKVYMAHGGKWSNGEFSSRPRVCNVDGRLIGLVKKVQRDANWQDRIHAPHHKVPPADDLNLVTRPPDAYIAPIISVEAVSADVESQLEAEISKYYNDSYAVEMEGYGFLSIAERENTSGIVIRGISDERKNKKPELDYIYQPVAAAHAAAFAFAAVELWGTTYPSPTVVSTLLAPSQFHAPQSLARPTPFNNPPPETDTFVMNFKGTTNDFPAERQATILQALRELTGDRYLEIIGTESGSFRLILRGVKGNLEKLKSQNMYRMLNQSLGATLISISPYDDYKSTADVQLALLVASNPLMNWPQTLSDNTWIDRPELGKLIESIENEDHSTTTVIGDPGSGKTALLARFAKTLEAKGVPFLAIKADHLDPAVTSEDDLRKYLDLEENPSTILKRLSCLHPVVLIIDQLDALAGYVDLRTGRLSVLLNLVRKLGLHRNVHIVLSARAFEYEHDTRLKTVHADRLTLELPAWSDILNILEPHGIMAGGWPKDAQEVMRSPQALTTFFLFNDKVTVEPFSTYQAMLEKLWQDRIVSQPNGGRIAKLAGRIAEDMAERETLWVSISKYDDQATDLKHLIANGILKHPSTPASIGFSHQTVFEYALARAFATKEGSLSSYVLDRESSLFVRPKLWASLTYLRAVDQPIYLAELSTTWSHTNLRRHLRYLLIEFIGQQAAPLEGEGVLMDQAIKSVDRRVCLQAVIGSSGWFDRYCHNAIPEAMSRPDEMSIAANILINSWSFACERIFTLLEKHWLPNNDCDGQTWRVLDEAPTWTNEYLELASTILTRTSIAPYMFDYTISTLGVEQPLIAARLALARLDALWSDALVEVERRVNLPKPEEDEHYLVEYSKWSPKKPLTEVVEQSDGWDSLEAVAKRDSRGFLSILWPWFKKVFDTLQKYDDSEPNLGFPLQYSLDFRFDDEHSRGLEEYPLLGALRAAAESLANTDPEAFLAWLDANSRENNTPVQRLLAHTLAGRPEKFAAASLQFLLSDEKRLFLGSIEDVEGTTKGLIKVASPFWNDKQIAQIVNQVRACAPKPSAWHSTPEKRRSFQRNVTRIKYRLLEALPQERLSKETKQFVEEQRRVFQDTPSGSVFSGVTAIGSIMTEDEIAKANDDDIINAFRQLPDATGWDHPKDWMKGGNIQLARAFSKFAKTNPERAIGILKALSPEIGTRAAGYTLEAIAEDAPPQLILEVLPELEACGFVGEEYRGNIARSIQRLVHRKIDIDDETLKMVVGWLTDTEATPKEEQLEDDDNFSEETKENTLEDILPARDQQKSADRVSSVLWGMGHVSLVPSGNFPILEVLIQILLQKKDQETLLGILMDHLEQPEEEKVWASLLNLIRSINPKDTTLLEGFLVKLYEKYPELSQTREAAMFLAYMHWQVPEFVRSVLVAWQSSKATLVQQAFGELVTLVWLMQPNLEWPKEMLEEILDDQVGPATIGATFAAVNVWPEAADKERALVVLDRIIPNADDGTWSALIDLFRIVDEINADPEWIRLLEAIAENISSHSSFTSTFFVEKLQTLLPQQSAIVAKIAKALIMQGGNKLGDIRSNSSSVVPELVDISITLHRLGPETREIGIELFEDLLDTNAYTAAETLSDIDNRFRNAPPAARRKLPRRKRRARRFD